MDAARLGTITSDQTPGRPLLVVPCGSTEQHGPHLPMETDTVIAREITQRVVERLVAGGIPALAAPAVEYGASGEHQQFPGTVSIGTEALTSLLVELGRSATHWCGRLVFISGHGGNAEALRRAASLLNYEGRPTAWTTCGEADFDAHAGWAETSMMLAVAANTVRLEAAVAGPSEPIARLVPAIRAGGIAAVSASGVLGDPSAASPDLGLALLERITARITAQIHAASTDEAGMLLRAAQAHRSRA